LRELQFLKNQYGPRSETIVLRYQNGLFLPVTGPSTLDQAARDQIVDDTYIKALRHFTNQGHDLGIYPTAPNYAPKCILRYPDVCDVRMQELEVAQQRLLDAEKIHIVTVGPPSKQRKYLRPGSEPKREASKLPSSASELGGL
jgi:hypothetical protein